MGSNNTAPNNLKKIGGLIKRYRSISGITQEALAEKAKTSRATINLLESGHNVRVSLLFKIADALKCKITDLITD